MEHFNAELAEYAWRWPIVIAWVFGLGCVFACEPNRAPFRHWSHFGAVAFLLVHIFLFASIAFDAMT